MTAPTTTPPPTRKPPKRKVTLSRTLEYRRDHYHRNGEGNRTKKRGEYDSMTAAERTERIWRQMAHPPQPREGSKNSKHPRKVTLARAYRAWSDDEEVFRTHVAAAVMSELFGVDYVVDHIVPLNGVFVSGFHTHDNLQVITARENQLKKNYLWPQMPALDWGAMDLLLQDPQT